MINSFRKYGIYGCIFKSTKGLLDKYGSERVIDSPNSEVYIAGGSVGGGYTVQLLCRMLGYLEGLDNRNLGVI